MKFHSALKDFFDEWKTSLERCLGEGVEQRFFKKSIYPVNTADLLISQIEGAIMLAKVDNSIDILEATCRVIRKLIVKNPNQQQNLLTLVSPLLYNPLFC